MQERLLEFEAVKKAHDDIKIDLDKRELEQKIKNDENIKNIE